MNRWLTDKVIRRIFYVLLVIGFQIALVSDDPAWAGRSEPLEIPNSGFEQWESDTAVPWVGEGANISRAAGVDIVTGNAALRADCTYAGSSVRLATDLTVTKNRTYAVYVWSRVEPGGRAKIQVDGMIEVDKNELPVGNDMQLVVYHFKTPGSGQFASKARLRFMALSPDTTIVLDDVKIVPGVADFSTLSAEELAGLAARWTFHPPEYYQQLRAECREHLREAKAAFDAEQHPEYRTLITQSDKAITLARQLYEIAFDRRSACITRMTSRGETHDGPALPDLTVVSKDGVVFSQGRATDGSLQVREDSFHIYLTSDFTPRSEDGRELGATFSVSYEFYKMAGFFTVHYEVSEIDTEAAFGGVQNISRVPPVKRLTVNHTIGKTAVPMNDYYRHYGMGTDGNYHQAKCYQLNSEEDAVLLPDRHKYCIWTNGAIGFGVYSRGTTYRQMHIESNTLSPRYFAYEVADGKRIISATFVHNQTAAALDPDFTADLAFCIFPIKAFQPTSRVHGTLSFFHLKDLAEDPAEVISVVSQVAQRGMTMATTLGCRRESLFPSNEAPGPGTLKRFEDTIVAWNQMLHDHGMQSAYSAIGYIQWPNELLEAEGFYTPDEMVQLREMGRGNRGQETPLAREFLLAMLYNALVHLDFDGIYFDLIGHELVTSTLFQQDVRLLCDHLPGDKFVVYHNHMEVSPPMALADYSVPGEQFMVAKWDAFPPSFLNIPYNPFLTGVHHRLYNDRSYDLRSGKIWHAAIRNVLSTDLNHFNPPEMIKTIGWRMAGRNDPRELEQFDKFGLANSIFDVGRSQLHHRYDQDYGDHVRTGLENIAVNVFSRPGESMVTLSHDGHLAGSEIRGVSFNRKSLELDDGDVLVYDTVHRRVLATTEVDGWVTLPPLAVEDEPRILVVKSVKGNRPTMLWHGPRVRHWRPVGTGAGEQDRYGKTGTDDPSRPFLWGGLKRVDFDFDSLPGQDVIAVHVGNLGRPHMLLGSVDHFSLSDYDRENQIVYIESIFPPNKQIATARVWFTFEWDDVTPESEW